MKHTILGAGPVGTAAAAALASRGLHVRLVSRRRPALLPPGVSHEALDVLDARALAAACDDSDVVYQCLNAPYHAWPERFPPLQRAAVAVARAAGARLVSFENVYMYGRPGHAPFTEASPDAPVGAKGRVRAAMARELDRLNADGVLNVAHVRASDLFGPGMLASMLGEQLLVRAVRGATARGFGDLDAPHTWTFTRDAGETLARVGLAGESGVFHVPSEPARSQNDVARDLEALLGRRVRLDATPPWLLRLVGVARPEAGAVVEMLYAFAAPFVVDDQQTRARIGQSPTRFAEALRETVDAFVARERGRRALAA